VNPLLVTIGLKLFKATLSSVKLRKSLTDTIATEKLDVSPEVVAALSGDADAIRLLSDQLDEAIATNKSIVSRLEAQVQRDGTRLDS